MNAMRILLLLCLCMLSAGSGIAGEDSYEQSYAILIKGAVAGTESVTERIAENGDLIAVSEHDMLITDGIETKRMAFATRMVLQKDAYAGDRRELWPQLLDDLVDAQLALRSWLRLGEDPTLVRRADPADRRHEGRDVRVFDEPVSHGRLVFHHVIK